MGEQARQDWTIQELGARVSRALEADYEGAPNGRVREVPDPRTIRYYTTLGLVDRPTAYHGRTALYGRRHLLQVVAIKRLQASGLSLEQVQHRLLGLSASSLEKLALLPAELEKAGRSLISPADAPPPPPVARPRAFWLQPPAAANRATSAQPPAYQGIVLAGDVILLVGGDEPLSADETQRLRIAAAPLLGALAALREEQETRNQGGRAALQAGDKDRADRALSRGGNDEPAAS